ncbi:MAG: M20/M25/M40 family metallo-hydrolase [Puniceicoccales bacterium]|nr:M20/M25/M40 family metallo-hydrolase [Puniceicoccales bacterium]
MDRSQWQILKSLIAIESVSANASAAKALVSAATLLGDALSSMGYETDCVEGYGPAPVVWARRGPSDAKTSLIIYGHYDVQPAEPRALWDSNPFKLVEKNGILYGRGVADDKGPLVAVLAALGDAINLKNVHITVLLEGAEEIGSAGFEKFLIDHMWEIRGHAAIIVDVGCPDCETPTLVTGLRGLMSFELSLRTATKDIHSGYGGSTPNALHDLIDICSEFHCEDGMVALRGFYLDVRFPEPDELKSFKRLDKLRNLAADLGVKSQQQVFSGIDASATHGVMPSLEINGFWGGHCGEGCKTIIPAEAFAKFTVRTVPDQRCDVMQQTIGDAIKSKCQPWAEMKLSCSAASDAYAINLESADRKFVALFSAMERALKSEFKTRPIRMREGGSIGIVGALKKILAVDSILVGVVPTASNIHAPNENWPVATFERTRRSICKFLSAAAKAAVA